MTQSTTPMPHWQGVLIFILFFVVLGTLLFIPAWLWARRQSRGQAALKFTKIGFVWFWSMMLLLLAGFSAEFVAPHSVLGKFIQLPGGRLIYTFVCFAVCGLVDVIFRKAGWQYFVVLPAQEAGIGARITGDAAQVFKQHGGVWTCCGSATWPFAVLRVRPDALELQILSRRWLFSPGRIVKISRVRGLMNFGIQIYSHEHAALGAPIFWTSNYSRLKQALHAAGYAVDESSTEWRLSLG